MGECANPAFTDGEDWLLDLVNAADAQDCTTPTADRSTEYDHLQFYWAMMVDQGQTPVTLLSLYDGANPRTWDPDTSTGSAADDPNARFETSANNLGILGAWQTEAASHGTDR